MCLIWFKQCLECAGGRNRASRNQSTMIRYRLEGTRSGDGWAAMKIAQEALKAVAWVFIFCRIKERISVNVDYYK